MNAGDERIRFETKAEANARREAAFLALSPAERFAWFLRSFKGRGPVEIPEHRDNFIVHKRRDPVR